MENPRVARLAEALRRSEIPPRFELDEARLLVRVLRLVADGRPVALQEIQRIASEVRVPSDAATAFLSRVSEQDREGRIVGILGLSQKPHPHRFTVNGRTLSTWCAWDSLFLPVLLGQTARVESACPSTRDRIQLTIAPDKVEGLDPATAAISIVVPETTKRGRDSVEEIWMTFCHFVHYFSSPEAASAWFEGRGREATILSVEEAYALGRLAFADLREAA